MNRWLLVLSLFLLVTLPVKGQHSNERPVGGTTSKAKSSKPSSRKNLLKHRQSTKKGEYDEIVDAAFTGDDGWLLIGHDKGISLYYDPSSVQVVDADTRNVWTRQLPALPNGVSPTTYNIDLLSIRCSLKQFAFLRFASVKDGKIGEFIDLKEEWEPIPLFSFIDTVKTKVCK